MENFDSADDVANRKKAHDTFWSIALGSTGTACLCLVFLPISLSTLAAMLGFGLAFLGCSYRLLWGHPHEYVSSKREDELRKHANLPKLQSALKALDMQNRPPTLREWKWLKRSADLESAQLSWEMTYR